MSFPPTTTPIQATPELVALVRRLVGIGHGRVRDPARKPSPEAMRALRRMTRTLAGWDRAAAKPAKNSTATSARPPRPRGRRRRRAAAKSPDPPAGPSPSTRKARPLFRATGPPSSRLSFRPKEPTTRRPQGSTRTASRRAKCTTNSSAELGAVGIRRKAILHRRTRPHGHRFRPGPRRRTAAMASVTRRRPRDHRADRGRRPRGSTRPDRGGARPASRRARCRRRPSPA